MRTALFLKWRTWRIWETIFPQKIVFTFLILIAVETKVNSFSSLLETTWFIVWRRFSPQKIVFTFLILIAVETKVNSFSSLLETTWFIVWARKEEESRAGIFECLNIFNLFFYHENTSQKIHFHFVQLPSPLPASLMPPPPSP